ncbi:uncharacterized protein F4822DRAFT_428243 [Hypoxylon trugodes]|uniref:uncharacterized protein n=1 Tax=Hypoxylon trugodes TaxID=326681 RepID=UPI0021993195|nr:uncharacterized protein F4822DRAFT_428243 [Hypoxylon trugodes]KAI1389902.1 hypothetical protein F4822DRAFT_428243 [Hypoxylon trugodes]
MSDRQQSETGHDLPPEDEWRAFGSHGDSNIEAIEYYVSISFFQKNDKVWYSPPGATNLEGPYTVISHDGNETYTIKLDSTGQTCTEIPKAKLQRF